MVLVNKQLKLVKEPGQCGVPRRAARWGAKPALLTARHRFQLGWLHRERHPKLNVKMHVGQYMAGKAGLPRSAREILLDK